APSGGAPRGGPRPNDVIGQPQPPAAPGAPPSQSILAASSQVERAGSGKRNARPHTPPPSIGGRTGPNQQNASSRPGIRRGQIRGGRALPPAARRRRPVSPPGVSPPREPPSTGP